MRTIPLFYFVWAMTVHVGAQNKLEREFRISSDEVPQQAIRFAESLVGSAKLKWYREEGIQQSSIEAKTKIKGQRFSIEFDTTGQIQDVEVEIPLFLVPESTREAMISAFREEFTTFKWQKIQVQYLGTSSELLAFFAQKQGSPSIRTQYEVVILGKKKGSNNFQEWLFSDTGVVLSKSIVILRISDNLEY